MVRAVLINTFRADLIVSNEALYVLQALTIFILTVSLSHFSYKKNYHSSLLNLSHYQIIKNKKIV